MSVLANVGNVPLSSDAGQGRRPINLVHLAKQSLGDPGLEEEILRMFDQLVETYMSRVRTQAPVGDASFNLHALKGAAGGIGADTLARLAETAEGELTPEGKLGAERVADLSHAVEEVRTFIAEILNE